MTRRTRWMGLSAIALALTGCAGGDEVGVSTEALTTFYVSDWRDEVDAAPGDGYCVTASLTCTLRAAVMEANALPGADEIVLGAGTYQLTLRGSGEDGSAMGDLDVTEPVTIRGEGAVHTFVVSANADRVLHNVGTRGLVVRDLTLQGGRAERNGEDGGGVLNAGGGETRLEHTRLRDHHARQGGGVFNEAGGDLRLTDVTLERNTAEAAGGLASDGSVRLVDTRFVDNEGTGDIGGARVSGSGRIERSTFRGNESGNVGALFVEGHVLVRNVTVSGNIGVTAGIEVAGSAQLEHVTIHDNAGGGLRNCDACGASTDVEHSIVSASPFSSGENCDGTVTSGGYNIDSARGCGFTAVGDMERTDPLLEPLAFEMSLTEVHPLAAGSPALDAAGTACVREDQRRVVRPSGAGCDIGAFEEVDARDAFCVDTLTDAEDVRPGDGVCDDGSGTCSLRAAVMETNALPGADTIRFCVDGLFALDLRGPHEDAAATGDLDILDALTVEGNGGQLTTILGHDDRIFDVAPGAERIPVLLRGLYLTKADPHDGSGGGVRNGTRALTVVDATEFYECASTILGVGGGIHNNGTLEVHGSDLHDNKATGGGTNFGGAIANDGELWVRDTRFTNNTSFGRGGAIYTSEGHSVVLERVTFESNDATGRGGAISAGGLVSGSDLTFIGNIAEIGGAVHAFGDAATFLSLERTSYYRNAARSNGSAIAGDGGTWVRLTNSTVYGGTGGDAVVLSRGWITNCTIHRNDGGLDGVAVRVANTILSDSRTGVECATPPTFSDGHNIDSGFTCALTGPNDLSGTSPLLGNWANHGGPTPTIDLTWGSPAIDAGDPALCPATDQRLMPRNGICDIGAFEY